MDDKIDFVVTWGSNDDPEWRKQREYYSAKAGRTVDNSVYRYREWDMLHYLFRGIDKYASWVNKIYFVTYGHLPKWLNTDNSKLVIVKHEEFIPAEYLPYYKYFLIPVFIWIGWNNLSFRPFLSHHGRKFNKRLKFFINFAFEYIYIRIVIYSS